MSDATKFDSIDWIITYTDSGKPGKKISVFDDLFLDNKILSTFEYNLILSNKVSTIKETTLSKKINVAIKM